MKLTALFLVANLASILCAAAAALLAYSGRDGWGWFLLVAVLMTTSSIKYGKHDDKETE